MKVKNYKEFILEDKADLTLPEDTIENEVEEKKKQDEPYQEALTEIKKLIQGTIDKNGGEFKQFLASFLQNPEETKIEGLINESDIYDFYLKYRNPIDEILNETKFYQQSPDENGCYGLYDYIILGTNKALIELVKLIEN